MAEEFTPTWEQIRWQCTYDGAHPDLPAEEQGVEADRWLAAHDAEVKAEAWDEGYQACRTRPSIDGYRINRTNPYRTEAPHA